jgi:hypothetical protein
VKLLSLREAETSPDIDIKMMATRSSRYRVFGSSERIAESEMAVIDLRDGLEPADFASQFRILDRHPLKPLCLVRKLA